MLRSFARPVVLLSGILASLSLQAQNAVQSAPAQSPVLQTNAQAVSVDVVVTAPNGDAVQGLGKQDLQLFQDGKAQTIDLFEEHTAPAVPLLIELPQLPAQTFTNRPAVPESDAVNILLLDSLNTPEADQQFVHQKIVNFIHDIRPGTRMAIFTLNTKLRLLEGFTTDASLLKQALDRKAAAPGATMASHTREDDLRDKEEVAIIAEMTGNADAYNNAAAKAHARTLADQASNMGGERASWTLAALQQLARSMAAVPGRKNLIWFAGTFPVTVFPNGRNLQTLSDGKDIGVAVRQTANLLTQARVALYPVAAHGIMVDNTTNADSAGQPLGDDFEKAPNQESAANSANTAAMQQLAHDTGGKAFYTSNNLSQSIGSAIQNGSHYYTLVYTPPSVQPDGRYHKIEVKLTAGKATLSYRRGYYADTVMDAKPASDPLPPLLARELPASTQILFQAHVAPLEPQPAVDAPRAGGNGKLAAPLTRYKVDLVINPSTVALDLAPDLTHNGKIEVALVAYDKAGQAVNWTGQTLGLGLNPDSYAQVKRVGIPVHLQIDLPATGLSLSTGVYDLTAHKAGTLEIPVPAQ